MTDFVGCVDRHNIAPARPKAAAAATNEATKEDLFPELDFDTSVNFASFHDNPLEARAKLSSEPSKIRQSPGTQPTVTFNINKIISQLFYITFVLVNFIKKLFQLGGYCFIEIILLRFKSLHQKISLLPAVARALQTSDNISPVALRPIELILASNIFDASIVKRHRQFKSFSNCSSLQIRIRHQQSAIIASPFGIAKLKNGRLDARIGCFGSHKGFTETEADFGNQLDFICEEPDIIAITGSIDDLFEANAVGGIAINDRNLRESAESAARIEGNLFHIVGLACLRTFIDVGQIAQNWGMQAPSAVTIGYFAIFSTAVEQILLRATPADAAHCIYDVTSEKPSVSYMDSPTDSRTYPILSHLSAIHQRWLQFLLALIYSTLHSLQLLRAAVFLANHELRQLFDGQLLEISHPMYRFDLLSKHPVAFRETVIASIVPILNYDGDALARLIQFVISIVVHMARFGQLRLTTVFACIGITPTLFFTSLSRLPVTRGSDKAIGHETWMKSLTADTISQLYDNNFKISSFNANFQQISTPPITDETIGGAVVEHVDRVDLVKDLDALTSTAAEASQLIKEAEKLDLFNSTRSILPDGLTIKFSTVQKVIEQPRLANDKLRHRAPPTPRVLLSSVYLLRYAWRLHERSQGHRRTRTQRRAHSPNQSAHFN
jgi:hypothetical protein